MAVVSLCNVAYLHPTLNLLCDELREVVEWDQIAVNLKVSYGDIKSIEGQYPDLWRRKMDSLQKWLDQSNTVHSWCTIADAVERVNSRVAEHIRTKYAAVLDQVPSHSQVKEHSSVNKDQYPPSKIKEQEQNESNIILERDVAEEITELEHRFAALVAETQECLEQRPNKLLPFYRYLRIRPLKGHKSLPDEKDVTYNKLFDILDDYWHYLKYQLLQRIIEVFLSDTDLPRKVKKYQDDLAAFKATKMRDLANMIKSKQMYPGEMTVELRVEEMWLDVPIQHFEHQVKLLFQDNDKSLRDITVSLSSMHVTWSVSKEIDLLITRSKFNSEMLKAIGVFSLKVGSTIIFSNEDLQDNMTLDSALLRAVQYGGPLSAISLLLEVGGNPNLLTQSGETVISKITQMKDKNDVTVLFVASLYGHSSVIFTLLNKGADPNITTKDGWTPLMIASENGHGDVVELLIENNVPVNTQSTDGTTAIFIASQNGHSSVVSTLLDKGADPNVTTNDGGTPLIIASQNGHGDVVELLLKKNVPVNTQSTDGTTAIFVASQNGHSTVVSTLLNNGADPNIATNNNITPLMKACQYGHGDVIELLIEKNIPVNTQSTDGMTAIYIASKNGHFSVISTLLNNGADPNIATNNGATPLMLASKNGHGDVVELLIEKNVPVNTQNTDGVTAIYIASQNGHSSVVSTLLNNGADPNISTNDDTTPLMKASENGHGDVVELLLKKKVPVNTQNTDGETAIYIASENGHSSVVSTLLNNGGDPNTSTNDGWTPLMIASENGHDDVVELLLEENVPVDTESTEEITAIFIASQTL